MPLAERVGLIRADGSGRGQLARDQVALDRGVRAGAVDRGLRVPGALDRQEPRRAEAAGADYDNGAEAKLAVACSETDNPRPSAEALATL